MYPGNASTFSSMCVNVSPIDVAFISLVKEDLFRFGVSPNKVFDYMYAKKPIIWAIEAGNNIVKEADCGYSVKLGELDKLKKIIIELKELPSSELKKLGNNGYNYVKKFHTYESISKKFLKLIEE